MGRPRIGDTAVMAQAPQRPGPGGPGSRAPSLARRAVLACASLAVVAGVVLAALVLGLSAQQSANERVRRSEAVLRTTGAAAGAVIDLETGLRGFVITGRDRFLEPWRTGRVRAARSTALLVAQASDDRGQRSRAAALQRAVQVYVREYGLPLIAGVRKDPLSLRNATATSAGKVRVDALRRDFAAFEAQERTRLQQRTQRADRDARRAEVIGIAGLGVLLALLIAVTLYVVRRVVLPVGNAARAADAMAAGDLGTRLPEDAPAELGQLSAAFNAMAAAVQRSSQSSTALLDTVFAQAPVGLALLDVELRFVRVNEAMARLSGLAAEAHPGVPLAAVNPGLAAAIEPLIRTTVEGGGAHVDVDVEAGTAAAPEDVRAWTVNVAPVQLASGEVVGIGMALTDVTDHRRAVVERERLLAAERVSSRRIADLQAVTAALSAAVGSDRVAQVIVEEAMRVLEADGAMLVLYDPTSLGLHLAAHVGYGPLDTGAWDRIAAERPTPVTDAARTGRTLVFTTPEALVERYPDLEPTIDAYEHRAWVAAPLRDASGIRGAVGLSFALARDLTPDELALLASVLGQGAGALERAAAYDRQRDIATALQRSLLPGTLPSIAGVELAAVFQPAGEGNEVGGDFYDVIPTGGDRWLLVIGDVQGKGAEAAALTGLVRHSLRAEAVHQQGPAQLLDLINRVVFQEDTDRFCTVVVAALDLAPDGATLTFACSGHPPPLVLRDTGHPEIATCAGPLLGLEAVIDVSEHSVALAPGDGLVLYTDGLLDARAPLVSLVPEDLGDVLVAHRGASPTEVAAVLRAEAIAGDRPPRDDIAILAMRLRPVAGDPG